MKIRILLTIVEIPENLAMKYYIFNVKLLEMNHENLQMW